jgi:tRNA (mo5U34)-methyltransferase
MLGVLYHLRYPLLGLERVYRVTKEMMVLETHVDMVESDDPVMRFYPGRELDGDSTNWWGPNLAAVESMLKVAGFTKVSMISAPKRRDPDRSRFEGIVSTFFHRPTTSAHQRGRAIFHARR